MADAYTSILSGSPNGYAVNTVKTAYDLAFGMVLRETPAYRAWVSSRGISNQTQPGQTVVLQKYDWFNAAAVTAAKTPLNEEQDVQARALPKTQTVSVTINEYGDASIITKLLESTSMGQVDSYAVTALGNQCAEVMDELVQDVMVTATQVIRAGNKAATNLITAADELTSADLRKAVTKLRSNKVPAIDGVNYAAGIHPKVSHDLREETGSGGWRVPQEYGVSQNRLWVGETGQWEGLRFMENTRTRNAASGASSAQVYQTYVQGREVIVERVVENPHTVFGPQVDKLGRFRTLGWYGLLGWAMYRNEAIVRIESGSSVAAL